MWAYIDARPRAISTQNINSSWDGAELNLFQPQKVIRRIQTDLNQPSQSTLPLATTNPFETALMISPIDVLATQIANNALNQLVSDRVPLLTSAHNYIQRLTQRMEQLHAENVILHKH